MSDDTNSSKLYEMAVRGSDFEDEYEFELYGEPVTAIIKPLVDDEFLPIAAFLSDQLDVDEDAESAEAVGQAVDRVEDASAEDEDVEQPIDISELNEEFVETMQAAAKLGLTASYDEDGNRVDLSDEEITEIVESMMGGYSVELGAQVLEISGDVRKAEKFRGSRGSVADSRAE